MDLNELEARAKAATQGEWVVGNNWNRAGVTPILFGDGKCFYCQKEGSPNPEREELGVINGKRMLMHWHRRATPINPEHVIETADGYHQITGNYEYEEGGVVRAEDAAYIAAASPQVVLALIEQIRTLESEVNATGFAENRMREALDELLDHETSGVCDSGWDKPATRPEHQHDRVMAIVDSALATPPTKAAQQIAALIAVAKAVVLYQDALTQADNAGIGYGIEENERLLTASMNALAAAIQAFKTP